MSLSQQAQQSAADKAAEDRLKADRQREARISARVTMIDDQLGFPAVYLDTVTIPTVDHRDAYSRRASFRDRRWDRFQVDDVIVMTGEPYHNSGVVLALERPCQSCGKRTPVRLFTSTQSDPEKRRARTVELIGKAMMPDTCQMCDENQPRECPECGRGN